MAVPGAIFANSAGSNIGSNLMSGTIKTPRHKMYDDDFIKKMADTANFTAKKAWRFLFRFPLKQLPFAECIHTRAGDTVNTRK